MHFRQKVVIRGAYVCAGGHDVRAAGA